MKIVEAFSQGKTSDATSEDGYLVTPAFAAVVDGSTSKSRRPRTGLSTGRAAMQTVCAALRTLPAESTMPQALTYLTDALRNATRSYYHTDQLPTEATDRLTCSAVVFSATRREVWFFGDCLGRWDGHTYKHPKAIDAVLASIRRDVVGWHLKHGMTSNEVRLCDPGRAFILPALREQCFFQNDTNACNPFRYLVLDATPADPALVRVEPVGTARYVVLASDGYPALFDTLNNTETHLANLLREDPLCIHQLLGTKCWAEGNRSYDDRTYLKIEL